MRTRTPLAALLGCLVVATSNAQLPLYTPWVPADQRTLLQNRDIAFKDHDGRAGMLGNLLDKPTVITFFYTRCQNARKCSMAISWLGALQRQLVQAGIAGQVRLLAITYE